MKIVPHHIIDSDTIPNQTINNIPLTKPPVQPSLTTSSPVQEDNSSNCRTITDETGDVNISSVEPLTTPSVQPSLPISSPVQEDNSSSCPSITNETGDINVSSVDENTDNRVEIVS